jgi:hypothetical protein
MLFSMLSGFDAAQCFSQCFSQCCRVSTPLNPLLHQDLAIGHRRNVCQSLRSPTYVWSSLVETVGISALVFGLVEGVVGVAQQGGGVGAILGKEGDADAGANVQLMVIDRKGKP